MKVVTNEKLEKGRVELVLEIPGDEFEGAVEAAYQRKKNYMAVPGFRKGKAPRKLIEKVYGAGVFYDEAFQALYPKAYQEAVEQEKLDVVSYPRIEVISVGAEGVRFKAVVAVKPEVVLGQYKGLSAQKAEVDVTEADIQNELKPYIERAARTEEVQRPLQMGDAAVIDFEGFDDGVPFEGGKAEKFSLGIGSGSFIPGFEEQLVGMNMGEEREISVTFPEDYAPELAGKTVMFRVKLHEARQTLLPVLDDEFAQDVSEFETMDAFREDLRQKLFERRRSEAETQFEGKILRQITDGMQVEIPDEMTAYRADRILEDYEARLKAQGVSFEDYLKAAKTSRAQLKESTMEDAFEQVKMDLAIDEIIRLEQITVSEEEREEAYRDMAERYHMEESKVRAAVSAEDLNVSLSRQKAAKLITDSAVVLPKEELQEAIGVQEAERGELQ